MSEDVQGLNSTSDVFEDGSAPRVVVITGMSGSGKSTAVNALEDAGFFCIDNLPVPLLPKVLEMATQRESRAAQPYAFVVDTRSKEFLGEAGGVLDQLSAEGVNVQVIFLEASDDRLVRRYSETRRRHPMSEGGTVREGIAAERAALGPLRARAGTIIDTTEHTVHTLKAFIQELVESISSSGLTVSVMSFGFKYGLPTECDLVFDVRFLPNPYFVEELRPRTGLDTEVSEYVLGYAEARQFIEHFQSMMGFMLPLYEREGKAYLTIGIGCTGGKHRSVALTEATAGLLRGRGWKSEPRHRDVGRYKSPKT